MYRTKDNIERLTERYIRQFESQLRRALMGDPKAHLPETEKLLESWKRVRTKNYDWRRLNEQERNLVIDAIMDDED